MFRKSKKLYSSQNLFKIRSRKSYYSQKLLKAMEIDKPEKIKKYLQKGADVNIKNNKGATALIWASENSFWATKKPNPEGLLISKDGYLEVIKFLIQSGADLNAKNNKGATALDYASWHYLDAVELLLQAGADPNSKDNVGNTALFTAVYKGHADIVKLLLQAGADVNVENNLGVTPLISAANHGHRELVSLFLQAGADFNAVNNVGDTALSSASKKGHLDVVKLLKEHIQKQKELTYLALLQGIEKHSLTSSSQYPGEILELINSFLPFIPNITIDFRKIVNKNTQNNNLLLFGRKNGFSFPSELNKSSESKIDSKKEIDYPRK